MPDRLWEIYISRNSGPNLLLHSGDIKSKLWHNLSIETHLDVKSSEKPHLRKNRDPVKTNDQFWATSKHNKTFSSSVELF